ncbi:tricalbin [Thelephora ganbajun]|uniref:Tricalbin n=1 Tax=Thelephora ganbajun TaxID=370292 RepID=A0ACB6ZLJ7_THEGA|nr:tricalbin [Thelephora ganbajun]
MTKSNRSFDQAVFATRFLTLFRFGWGWLIILLAICVTYYSASMARVRRRARDDIQRELLKSRLASEHESAEWLNHFLQRFWVIYEPVLSATVVSTVDQLLSANCPPFLDSLRLTTFTLGNKAFRIDQVRTFPKTEEDIVMMDWAVSFTPNDVSDMTPKEAVKKVNPKIVLSVRLGKGLATTAMPILLEDLSFSGNMRVRMKLMTNFPHVQLVDLTFLEPPIFDYVLKPIGGEHFGFDIGHLPGLSPFIRNTVHSILGPMMYDPHVFTLNLEQILSGIPLDAAIGVLQVVVRSARDIKGGKIGGGTPDPYVSLTLNERAELAKTKYKHDTHNPTWMETKFLLVNSLHESLVLNVVDYNDHRPDTHMGSASFALGILEHDAAQEDISRPILKDGKDRGELRFDVSFYPVISLSKTSEGTVQKLPETNVGIVRLVLHQAKDLDHSKSMSGDLNPFVKVYLGNQSTPTHISNHLRHTNNPVWESATEFLCTDKKTSIITVKVIDDRDFLKDPVVGYMSVRLTDLLRAKEQAGRDWWPLSGCNSGRIRLSTEWKPLDLSLHGVDRYVPPIGVVRLWLKKATDVKNVEAALGGKSDPYVRVLVNNVIEARTEVINNNLNPVWDQIIYVPVHSMKETLFLECMDYQHVTKDRTLGYTELCPNELAIEVDSEEYPYRSTGKKVEAADLKLEKGIFKGQLHYEAEFIPALALKNFKFSTGGNDIQHAISRPNGDASSIANGDGGSISSSDVEAESVPAGITTRGPLGVKSSENHVKEKGSTDTALTADGDFDTHPIIDPPVANEKAGSGKGVVLSKEELMQHQSGIIVFNITTAQLTRKARLEVLLDDAYWPAFTTSMARSRNVTWDYTGEGFIKELDFGRVWLRFNEADEGTRDDIIAEWKEDAKKFLQEAMNGTVKRTLFDSDGKSMGTVELEARYIPVPIKLEPRESINNQGVLQVQLLNGGDIIGADRSGKSDPFVVFTLNGQKVFKSQTKKKTLSPEWNETFAAMIPSRVAADFHLEVFDWNQIEQAKSLGIAKINLEEIEPFQGVEKTLPLSLEKHGEKGWVRVHLNFQPEIIVKSRSKTSTFSTAGRAMTQVGSLPLQAGKGVFHGVTRAFGRGGNHSSDEGSIIDVAEIGTGQASQPIGADGIGIGENVFTPPGQGISGAVGYASGHLTEPGIVKVTVLEAKDYNPSGDGLKPYVILKSGEKEHKTSHRPKSTSSECSWNEQCAFVISSNQSRIQAWVHDYKTIGRDKLLGAGEIDVWRHLNPANGIHSSEVLVQLNEGQGLLKVRLDYSQDGYHHLPRGGSFYSLADAVNTKAMTSPSRFSLRNKRPGAGGDDS